MISSLIEGGCGASGPAGPAGPAGPTGATGATGPAGPDPIRLIHFINDGPTAPYLTGAYKETLPAANPFPTSIVWYTNVAKTHKIVEKTYVYSGVFPTTITWKMYAPDGTTVTETATDTIVYSGPFELNRTRSIT